MTCGRVSYSGQCRLLLYDYKPAAPNNFETNRGLDNDIVNTGYSAFVADHETYEADAAKYGIEIGFAINSPFGRGPDYETLPNGAFTTYHLDQLNKAVAAGFTNIEADLVANTTPSRTVLYLGSIPVMTFAEAGLTDLISLGYKFAFDALTTYESTDTIFTQAVTLSATNYVWAEANKTDQGLPLLAAAGLWEDESRVVFADAPANSAWWWRGTVQDGAWDIADATTALNSGMVLWVRLNQLTASERSALYALVSKYQSGILYKSCTYYGAISSKGCCYSPLYVPFASGIDIFGANIGPGYSTSPVTGDVGGGGGWNGNVDFGGDGNDIGDGDDGGNWFDGDADFGGNGDDIGGDDDGGNWFDGDANFGGDGNDLGDDGGGGGSNHGPPSDGGGAIYIG